MAVNRIVTNVATEELEKAKAFYCDLLDMTVAMDHGWIITLIGTGQASPQISFATEGGSGTPVPDLSIEVDDLPSILARLTDAGYAPSYGPVKEPWGVHRFYVRDPFGRL
ncbi:VOC family protein [Aurantiacibacter poecillastricola]|uniref:VOC family protein n=1 Tax=Aurantiacibacter poecillastricola TaxID=3064385 RepID=UPI0027401011|nr:VOC family protein [Aurantiacibacter sp. 219JJ12-13]MDP5263641.1 VOC family protein [Aurantiacibacter sp. 219JJ12-13]